ncbi:phage adaptor protein [Paenibacillus sp. DMB20]|uniref:phage adaptor protein n=1 Tax=Paenibacillus sp. DMB20 TaxID=1642570 RepID=UPI0006275064|nr:hypothetical protein [Paenibacillus sp. DMB20]KKO51154.1 hypothetical protein XI25_29650 [Paenibacillus sp. DMB20]
MSTAANLMADINLRYRNTFTTTQKLVWFNEEQQELFGILQIDSPPYAFKTVASQNLYPFPLEFDVTKIKVVTYQTNDNNVFTEVPALRNDDNQYASSSSLWYIVISNAMFLNIPGGAVDNRTVYIYCDSDPTEVTEATINLPPDLPTKYHEILKFGVLERIAAARKDVIMKNNFAADKQDKIENVLWEQKLQEPEWTKPIDVMPRAGNHGYRWW